MRIERSIEVNAPAERVWHIATDPNLGPRWNPNVKEIRDFTGLPIRMGSQWTQVVRIMGRDTVLRATVVACDPPRSGTVKMTGPGNPSITTSVEPRGAGSLLTQVMDVFPPPGLGGIAMKLAGPTIQSEIEGALRRQKQAAESDEMK